MLDTLDRKLRQMHAALDAIATKDVSGIKPQMESTATYVSMQVDFNANSDPIKLANASTLLIANIASLKDHLKAWCKLKGCLFNGDALINSNNAVALIHDLWNVDKHAELTSKPRSGYVPELRDIRQALVVSAGAEANSGAFYSMDPRTGQVTSGASGSGSIKISLTAQVVDNEGNVLGELSSLCIEAIAAWEKEFVAVGVPLP